MKKSRSLIVARSGITGALYIALTFCFAPISFGMVQFRISEALCVLPLFFPECSIGLALGCLISNAIFSSPLDVLFGTIASLFSGILTAIVGLKVKNATLKIVLGELPPIILNAIFVPFAFFVATDGVFGYLFNVATVGLGQLAVICVLGTFICLGLQKYYNPRYKSINDTKPEPSKQIDNDKKE